jgi:hypothetical protein
LAVQLGERMNVEVPDLKLKGGDPELAQIQQMEATADLLESILQASGGEAQAESETEPESDDKVSDESADAPRASKKGAKKSAKKGTRRK